MNGTFLDYTGESGEIDLEFPYGTDRALLEFRDVFGESLLHKTHVVNFASGSHGHVDDDVFKTTLPDTIDLNTSGSDVTIDFTLSGVDASLMTSADALFLQNGSNFQVNCCHTKYCKEICAYSQLGLGFELRYILGIF